MNTYLVNLLRFELLGGRDGDAGTGLILAYSMCLLFILDALENKLREKSHNSLRFNIRVCYKAS